MLQTNRGGVSLQTLVSNLKTIGVCSGRFQFKGFCGPESLLFSSAGSWLSKTTWTSKPPVMEETFGYLKTVAEDLERLDFHVDDTKITFPSGAAEPTDMKHKKNGTRRCAFLQVWLFHAHINRLLCF